MQISDPVGLQGQPAETLEAVRRELKPFDLERTVVVLVTDWQDSRGNARYALLARDGERVLLSESAFGPLYGESGTAALRTLVRGLLDDGAVNFKETIVAPHEFSRLLEDPTPEGLVGLLASANPSDPQLYLE